MWWNVLLSVISVVYLSYSLDDGLENVPWPNPSEGGQTATIHLLKEAVTIGAVCLDGTPPAYYMAPGNGSGSTKWYVHMQGGGWCENLESCLKRSNTDLGSSKKYPPTANLGSGYFSDDPTVNPQMYNWNKVFMRYCDGGSFSGHNLTVTEYKGKKLYFRGKMILDLMLTDLMNEGFQDSTDIVVSGCSAGGLASWLHTDKIRSYFPKDVKVVGLPDSGFFLDYEAPGKRYHSGMIWVFNYMNASSGVHQGCIAGETNDPWKCMFAEHTAPYIKTPMFPLQSEYDSWQISQDLNSNDPALINQWGANLTKLVQYNFLQATNHGIFLDSCEHHCGEWGSIRIDGDLQAIAFQKFYNDQKTKRVWYQKQKFPCVDCCKPNHN